MKSGKEINIIVATSTDYGIGYDNKMSWYIAEELRNFMRVTSTTVDKNKKNCVIMGKNTWYSLPKDKRPLKNRINIVLSSEEADFVCGLNDVLVLKDFDKAIKYVEDNDAIEKAYVIGGEKLYNRVLSEYSSYISKIYLSIVYDKEYICNKFIDKEAIYNTFKFEKDNIHFTERYAYMIGYNKKMYLNVSDERAD